MPSQVTVTAKTGPDRQNTALVLTNVTRMNFDQIGRTLQVTIEGPVPLIKEYDLVGVTTVTCSVSGGNYTWVVS